MAVFLSFLQILGSLGVFLYGMKVMSEGIQRGAGDRMRKVMETMTHNRFTAVLTGAFTTGLLQSSSATTVMVVSFVNAGLLTLVESIGIIMGANLGTTLTAWIIALVGKFSIAKIAIPIIGVGLPFFFVGKDRWRSFGESLIGFGLLFFGLGLLKNSVPDVKGMLGSTDAEIVAQAEAVLGFVKGLSGYGYGSLLIFLLIGIVLTLVVQSSSAAMAITVTLAINGWIGFHESAAIVLGENIGTTVTAWLASLGANVGARRAARAHFLFNVLGVTWMLIAFYPFTGFVEWLAAQLPESLRTDRIATDMGFTLAIFHSLFNLLNICILVGFVPLIAKLVTRWVQEPPPSPRRRLKFISQSRLDVGELNMPEAEEAIRELSGLTLEMFDGCMRVFDNPNHDLSSEVERLKQLEDDADVLTHDITEYLVQTTAAEISVENAQVVGSFLRNVAELEEISDSIYRLIRMAERRYQKGYALGEEASAGLRSLSEATRLSILYYDQNLLSPLGQAQLEEIQEIEERTDVLRKEHNRQAMERIKSGSDVPAEMLIIDMSNHLESIANHARNVVEQAHLGQSGNDPEVTE